MGGLLIVIYYKRAGYITCMVCGQCGLQWPVCSAVAHVYSAVAHVYSAVAHVFPISGLAARYLKLTVPSL